MAGTEKTRLHLLDALRGFTMVNMIAYHGMWDLVYLFGVPAAWYTGRGSYVWQQTICWTFLLLSGFCWRFSRNPARRGLLVFGCGALITAVTVLVMPENRVVFGILTCIGSCMLLMIPVARLTKKLPAEVGLGVSLGLFALLRNCGRGSLGFEGLVLAKLPEALYRNSLSAYLGFPYRGFSSADYFGLLPWFFLFAAGYFLCRVLDARNLNQKLFGRGKLPVLNAMGRHSLLIYLLHQPVLYGLCVAAQALLCGS